jgi:hypothetical protein
MAFKRASAKIGLSTTPEQYQMTDGEASVSGEALVLTSGRLTKCGATVTPEFIAIATAAVATPGAIIQVERTNEGIEYETQANATVAATLVGQKVTLHTDGLLVTATTTSGVFEITSTDGVTSGGTARGMFRR